MIFVSQDNAHIVRLRKYEAEGQLSTSAVMIAWKNHPDYGRIEVYNDPFVRLRDWDSLWVCYDKGQKKLEVLAILCLIFFLGAVADMLMHHPKPNDPINIRAWIQFACVGAAVVTLIVGMFIKDKRDEFYVSKFHWIEIDIKFFLQWLSGLVILLGHKDEYVRGIKDVKILAQVADDVVLKKVIRAAELQRDLPKKINLGSELETGINPETVRRFASEAAQAKDDSLETWRELSKLKLIDYPYKAYWQRAGVLPVANTPHCIVCGDATVKHGTGFKCLNCGSFMEK